RTFDAAGPEDERVPRSAVIVAKRAAADRALQRMQQAVNRLDQGVRLPNTIDELDRHFNPDWLAIGHADGNGLGKVFLNFPGQFRSTLGQTQFVEALRTFSELLDDCSLKAFVSACRHVPARRGRETMFLPIVPLILGGDDLT